MDNPETQEKQDTRRHTTKTNKAISTQQIKKISMFLICKDIIILHILVFLLCHGIRICSFLESCTWHQRNQIAQGFVVVIIN
jgi:t-SNARE complex subunit (syntaxin)